MSILNRLMRVLAFTASALLVAAATVSIRADAPVALPPPKAQAPVVAAPTETIVLAAGGFWGAQAVFDAMFADMDSNLREIGVGDLSVGKRVRAMWEAFHGRSKVYSAALEAADRDALAAALVRNVWRGSAPEGAAEALAARVLRQAVHLASLPLDSFASGRAEFLAP